MNTQKLIQEMHDLKLLDNAWELYKGVDACIALVKKHMGGDMCVCGHEKDRHNYSAQAYEYTTPNGHGECDRAGCSCTKFTSQQERGEVDRVMRCEVEIDGIRNRLTALEAKVEGGAR